MDSHFQNFIQSLEKSINQNIIVKLTLSKIRIHKNELKNVFVKQVMLKTGLHLSFVYRYPTKDITKNFEIIEGIKLIEEMLKNEFLQADLFTTEEDFHLLINKTGSSKLIKKESLNKLKPILNHDRIKTRFVNTENNIYLKELGVLTADEKVKNDMQDKFRQINKYIEIIDGILSSSALPQTFNVVDMGAGKGYLTFALYDYLVNNLKYSPNILGIEIRKELVETCNKIAQKSGFDNLKFIECRNESVELTKNDILIALHACDTATDEAIFRGIKLHSQIIICAPCCHKQIRKQLNPANDLKSITKYGILEERQAEIITDSIRALILEAYGYKTKVFEFISTEHTPKNVLIVGIKKSQSSTVNQEILKQINGLKKLYGIEYHHLEKLLEIV